MGRNDSNPNVFGETLQYGYVFFVSLTSDIRFMGRFLWMLLGWRFAKYTSLKSSYVMN